MASAAAVAVAVTVEEAGPAEMIVDDLYFSTDNDPGIRRLGKRRFRYIDSSGRPVTGETLERITGLVIPPAWTSVWICADERGHLQATGRDARGRKQYLYHLRFRAHREETKFRDLIPFAERLPHVRAQVKADLALPGLPRERVLALVVRLLEETYARVGNEEYARTNGSYGLTTLRDEHLRKIHGELRLQFRGKHGLPHDVPVEDRRLTRLVKQCQDLPGQILFQYRTENGPCPVHSSDVNRYLQDCAGIPVTAKTFRTWGATLLAATALAAVEPPASERLRKRLVTVAVGRVAKELGNTPAVCRRSYIHPVIMDSFMEGDLRERWESGPKADGHGLLREERRLLAVLQDHHSAVQ
ncbi:MAG: topA [Acidimicrobiia bacterium]|nr:topA [Acidimicrobiia bacterium]